MIAVTISIIGMTFSTVSTVASIYATLSDPVAYQQFCNQYEAMTGLSFEEELNQFKSLIPFFE